MSTWYCSNCSQCKLNIKKKSNTGLLKFYCTRCEGYYSFAIPAPVNIDEIKNLVGMILSNNLSLSDTEKVMLTMLVRDHEVSVVTEPFTIVGSKLRLLVQAGDFYTIKPIDKMTRTRTMHVYKRDRKKFYNIIFSNIDYIESDWHID